MIHISESIDSALHCIANAAPDMREKVFANMAPEAIRYAGVEGIDRVVITDQLAELSRIFDWDIDAGQAKLAEAIRKADTPTAFPKVREITQQGQISATRFVLRDSALIPPREWLYDRHYIRRYVTGTIAAPDVGKTSIALAEALAMVTGKPLLGAPVRKQLSVWYWNGEDPLEEIERHIAALCQHYQISSHDIAGRLYIDSGRDTPIIIGQTTKDGTHVNDAVVDALVKQCFAKKIDLMMLDPFVSTHRVAESDNGGIDQIVKAGFGVLAERANIGVDIQHHVRKGPTGASEDRTVDDARGASALIGAVRSARVLNRMSTSEAGQLGLLPDEARLIIRVDNGKSNMQRPNATATWRKLQSVPLGNQTSELPEDIVQVATAYEPPDLMAGIVADDVRKVQEAVAAKECAVSSQANDWAGYVVAEALGLKTNTKSEKAKVSGLIKVWLNSGALTVERSHNTKKGRDRPMIVVGTLAA